MSKLSYSRYNYEVTLPDGSRAIYNLASKQKMVLQSPIKEIFDGILDAPDSNLSRKWRKAGFLVAGDELTELKLFSSLSSASHQDLKLVIAPTLACNFRCPYCYETHTPTVMSQEIQDKLVDMVQDYFLLCHPHDLSVTWYGGEPLLQPKIIENLSHRFIELCTENNVKYSACITTNGYLLTQEIADMLSECRVSICQITLDGLRECNDRTRVLADGGGSFNVITDNLRNLKLSFDVNVRCILTQQNKQDFPGLQKLIQEIGEQSGNKLSCSYRPMDNLIALDRASLHEEVVSIKDFMNFMDSSVRVLSKGAYDLCDCESNQVGFFVVAPDGNLYKCWEDITVSSMRVANLLEDRRPFLTQLRNEVGKIYLDVTSILDDEECRECQLLPVCKGGCPHRRCVVKEKVCLKPAAKWLNECIVKQFVNEKNYSNCNYISND